MSESAGLRVLFSGRVQGVGFRWTVQEICSRRSLGGWVRNLPDGRVEAEIFGSMDDVRAAVAEIQRSRPGLVREVVESPTRGVAGEDGFEIRYR